MILACLLVDTCSGCDGVEDVFCAVLAVPAVVLMVLMLLIVLMVLMILMILMVKHCSGRCAFDTSVPWRCCYHEVISHLLVTKCTQLGLSKYK